MTPSRMPVEIRWMRSSRASTWRSAVVFSIVVAVVEECRHLAVAIGEQRHAAMGIEWKRAGDWRAKVEVRENDHLEITDFFTLQARD